MDTNTGELGHYLELLGKADDPADVVLIPRYLEPDVQRHLQRQGRVVDLEKDSPLAQFARDHQRRKKQVKAKARNHRKQVRRDKSARRQRKR